MVDNIAVTEGSGKTVATDDVSGVQYQVVKLDIGGDGVSKPVSDTTNPIPVDAGRITAPTIYNVTLTNADTEYSQALPSNVRFFEFQCLTAYDVRFAFVTGKVATPTAPYMTLKANVGYSSPEINQGSSPSTLYLASSTAGVIVQILAWT